MPTVEALLGLDADALKWRVTRAELTEAIARDLSDRTSWESKQGDLYKARFRGLRRTNPPWPNASDINWPLIDGIVEKLKPHYLQQLYANELIASFAPAVTDPEVLRRCGSAAQWFDWELKQNSNLETAILHVIDYQLMLGRPAAKVTWDVDKGQLVFEPIAPDKLVVPACTESLEDADRIVHVLTYTPERYKRQGFKSDESTIKSITGRRSDTNAGGASVHLANMNRTGITEGEAGEIIVWEVWIQEEAGKWVRETFSPLKPDLDLRERATDPLGKIGHPFVDFANEITQPDWYSPRGIGEIVLTFQAQLTKLLNEKNDAMTLSNRPLFRAERDGVETNLRWRPGQILPTGVQPVTMPAPPIQFDVHINLMRQVAEGLIGTPDFGMSRQGDMRTARTATEMEQVAAMNAQSGDLRMRVFRMSLGRLYQKAWATLREYAGGTERKYWKDETVENVGADVIGSSFKVKPSGSADGVTRQRLWQKAVARLQMFNADPYTNQGELRKSVLEADDPGLVKRLYQDPGVGMAVQAEEQAMEIGIMRIGFPAVVSPADDHATHIRTMLLYVQQQNQTGQPPAPLEMQRIQEHLMAHVQALQQVDPKQAKAAMDAIETIGTAMSQPAEGQEVAA